MAASRYGDDDVAHLVPFVDIAVSLDDLIQGKAPTNDRFDLPRLKEFLEMDKIPRLLFGWGGNGQKGAPLLQRPFAA